MNNKLIKLFSISSLLAVTLTGCLFESSSDKEKNQNVAQVEGLYFVGSDYSTGALYTLDSTQKKASKLLEVSQDSKVFASSKGLVVLERTDADNILLFDLDSSKVIYQKSLGEGVNASDMIEYAEGFALVSLYNEGSLIKVDLATGEVVDELDLSSFAAEGALSPNPNDLTKIDDLIYVSLQRFDGSWSADTAYILAVDPEAMSIVDTLITAGKNPNQILNVEGDLLVVFDGTTTYDANYVGTSGNDSYVALIDLDSESESLWIDEEKTGEKIKEVLITENKIYMVTSSGWGSNTVKLFDATGKTLSALSGVTDASGGLVEYDNKLWIGERSFGEEAILAFEQDELAYSVAGDYLAPYGIIGVEANP